MNHHEHARRNALKRMAGTTLFLSLPAYSPAAAHAENYPNALVRIIVGFPPGGTNDILARLVAARLQEILGQDFIVENKPGAASAIGNDLVAKAKPDGYTLLISSSGGMTSNPVLMKNLSHNPATDFEPIALLATFPLVAVVHPSSPVNSLADFVKLAATRQDKKLNNGTPTTSFTLVAETIASTVGLKFEHVQYRGSGPTAVAVMSNELDLAFLDSPAVVPYIKAGKLKAIVVTTGKRSPVLPNVPTVAESGYAGYDIPIWTAMMGPKGMPESAVNVLQTAIAKILQDKEFKEKLYSLALDVGDVDSAALHRRIVNDIARWKDVAKKAHIEPQ